MVEADDPRPQQAFSLGWCSANAQLSRAFTLGFKLLLMTADASSSANASKPIIRSACVDREPKTSLQIEVWSDGAGKSSIRFDEVVDAALGLALAP